MVNLPSYRPELKGAVEKFFDLVQNTYKPHLKGKGVIEPDYQERGSHDYRKDACLTMADFEKVILRCIIYYNSQRIIENFPVAYNPDDVSEVWLIDNGSYIRFNLIESRYKGKELSDVEIMQKGQKELVKAATADNIQAQINLAQSIEIIAASVNNPDKVNVKSIRNTRQREQTKNHIDYIRGIEA